MALALLYIPSTERRTSTCLANQSLRIFKISGVEVTTEIA